MHMSIELLLDFFNLFLCHKIHNVLACKNTPCRFLTKTILVQSTYITIHCITNLLLILSETMSSWNI